jgi:hypothetical protein
MRRVAAALVGLLMVAGSVHAGPPITVNSYGNPDATINVTLSDSWQSLSTLVGGLKQPNRDHLGALIQIRTGGNAAQVAHGITAPTVTGYELLAGGSLMMQGAQALETLWLKNDSPGNDAALVVTVYR